jgi:hypothetical protein
MPISDAERVTIERFRQHIEAELTQIPGLGPATRVDRADGATLATRFPVGENLWLELALRPLIPQLRAGIVTTDRWLSEELEEAIEETGDTMSEFMEDGFDQVDLHWTEPPVEHYRDHGRDYYFATPLELERLEQLGEDATRTRAGQMVRGYYAAFQSRIAKRDD